MTSALGAPNELTCSTRRVRRGIQACASSYRESSSCCLLTRSSMSLTSRSSCLRDHITIFPLMIGILQGRNDTTQRHARLCPQLQRSGPLSSSTLAPRCSVLAPFPSPPPTSSSPARAKTLSHMWSAPWCTTQVHASKPLKAPRTSQKTYKIALERTVLGGHSTRC